MTTDNKNGDVKNIDAIKVEGKSGATTSSTTASITPFPTNALHQQVGQQGEQQGGVASRSPYATKSDPLPALLEERCGSLGITVRRELDDVVVSITRERVFEFCTNLKNDSQLRFNLLVDITAIDWLDSRDERYEVVYHLMSMPYHYRLRVKVVVPESDPTVPSVSELWASALFMERETWDMYGIVFKGHKDLRRLLMYDEFQGHPLRKDYPLQAKQPRVPLRAPEVRNTATDMQRPALVQINKQVKKTTGVATEPSGDVRGMNRVLASGVLADQVEERKE